MGSPQSESKSTLPWVALILSAVLTLTALHFERLSEPVAEEARSQLSEALAFFEAHPYLEPGAGLFVLKSRNDLLELRERWDQRREKRRDPEVLPGVLRREQQKLDGMLRSAAETLSTLPALRYGVNPADWKPLDLLDYLLVHSSVWQLAGNVLLLLLLGVYLEPMFGPVRTTLVMLAAAVGAGLGHVLFAPGAQHVLIGSSGLLAGLLAVFALTFRSSRAENFYAVAVVSGALWLLLPPWLGVPWSLRYPGASLVGPLPPPRLVYGSYAGAVVGAIAMHWLIGLLMGRRSEGAAVAHSARTSTGSVGLDQALQSRAAGRDELAFQQLTALLAREPEHLDAALLLSDVSRSLSRHTKADEAMLRAIRIEAKRGEGTAAVRHWLDLTHREIPPGADPALLIRIATLLRRHQYPRAASQALREALSRASGSNTAPVAGRVARAAQELDPEVAHDAAWKALNSADLPLEERQNLEGLLSVVMPKLPGAEVLLSQAWAQQGGRAAPIDVGSARTRILDIVHAVPTEIDDEGLHIATRGGNKKRVKFERIEAVAVAAVERPSQRPVLIVDLVLNWKDTRESRLRVIRLRGDRFDPRRIVGAEAPLDAFRGLVAALLERSAAMPLPDRDTVLGSPFASFGELAIYERTVLMAEAPLSENRA